MLRFYSQVNSRNRPRLHFMYLQSAASVRNLVFDGLKSICLEAGFNIAVPSIKNFYQLLKFQNRGTATIVYNCATKYIRKVYSQLLEEHIRLAYLNQCLFV